MLPDQSEPLSNGKNCDSTFLQRSVKQPHHQVKCLSSVRWMACTVEENTCCKPVVNENDNE